MLEEDKCSGAPSGIQHTMLFEIKEHADIARMEAHVKELLGCQGPYCTLLQSSMYKNLQMTLLLKLNGVISSDACMSVSLGMGGLLMTMHPCATKVEITRHEPQSEPSPKRKKRKAAACDPMENWAEQFTKERKRSSDVLQGF